MSKAVYSQAYRSTAVPVARSQESIRQLLIKFGARGVQFTEDFEKNQINIRFAKFHNDNLRTVSVTMLVPEPPIQKRRGGRNYRYVRGKLVMNKSEQERREQLKRATYRALHDWLKSQFVAVEFGLLSFEDIFLSHFEWIMKDGSVTTVGKFIAPRLDNPMPLLSAGESVKENVTEGTWEEVTS